MKKGNVVKSIANLLITMLIGLNIIDIIAQSNFTAAASLFWGMIIGMEINKLLVERAWYEANSKVGE